MQLQGFMLLAGAFVRLASACACHHDQVYDASSLLSRRSKPPVFGGDKTVLSNVRIFDGYKIACPQTVYMDRGLISSPFPDCAAARVIDGQGRILIPGLMDAHVHVPDVDNLETMTSWGVTTGFNMACRNYTECHALSNYPKTPEGAGIAGLFSAGRAANSNSSGTDALFNTTGAEVINDGDDPVPYVKRAYRSGSDYFKIVSKSPPMSQHLQGGLVAAAHRLGLQTMTHAADLASYRLAISSGTDVIQHMPDDGLLTRDDMASISRVRDRQFSTPTLNIFRIGYSDPSIAQLLRPNNTGGSYEHVRQNTAALHRAGVLILAGTDAVGSFYTPIGTFSVPIGPSLHSELEYLVEAGLSNVEALRAATVNIAEAHRLHDRGSIEIGKRADLVLLNADPLVDISNTRQIARVWVGGVEYPDVARS